MKNRQKKIKGESLESLRRKVSLNKTNNGKVKNIFDLLEGTLLADQIQERIHFTTKPLIIGRPIDEILAYGGPKPLK